MPLDEAAGCLATVLRALGALFELLAGFIDVGELLGFIGKWTLYAISLGRCERESDDPSCVLTGVLLCVGLLALGVWLNAA